MDVLSNKSYRDYVKISRYNNFPYFYHRIDRKYVYGITRQLNKETPSMLYTTVKGDTYDSISLKFYNNPLFYWAICDFNSIQDPFTQPEQGTKLRIPTLSEIDFKA